MPVLRAVAFCLLSVLVAGCLDDVSLEADRPQLGASSPSPRAPHTARSATVDVAPDQRLPSQVPALHPSVDGYPAGVVTLADGERDVEVLVRVASTPEQRRHGLMEVEHLPEGTGMLFVFDEERQGGFWMKDTLIPLSIAFVGSDGDVRAILDMSPCEADPCEVYDPDVSYRYALEVPDGWFGDVGVTEGWQLHLPASVAG